MHYLPWTNDRTVHIQEVADLMADHLRLIDSYHGPLTAPVVFRKLFAWYIKGFRDVKPLKERAFRAKTTGEVLELITEFRENAFYLQKVGIEHGEE